MIKLSGSKVSVVLLILGTASVLMLEQSNGAQLRRETTKGGNARQAQQRTRTDNSGTARNTTLAKSNGQSSKLAALRRGSPMQSGLNFAPAVTYGSGGWNAYSIAVGDLNGDGKLDLVVSNYCITDDYNDCADLHQLNGSVGVLMGNGDGTFQPVVTYSSGASGTISVAIGDVNEDGKLDLVVTSYCENSACTDGTVGVLLGNGDGTFQPVMNYTSGGFSTDAVALADVNGDGKLDVVVANFLANNNTEEGSVGVLLGNGDGTFQPAVSYDSGGSQALSVAVADVNGDGKADLIVGNYISNTVGVLLGNGDGTFQPVAVYGSGGDVKAVLVGDVNADGELDILVANYYGPYGGGTGNAGVLLGNGDGTFQPVVTYNSGGLYPDGVALGDVDGDGKLDLIVSNQWNSSKPTFGLVGVLLGNGNGTFQNPVTYGTGGLSTAAVVMADVNGDGKPDLAAPNICADENCLTGSVGVLINTSISPSTTSLTSSPNPSAFGQAVTFTATVTSDGFKSVPTGSVSFFDGTTNIGNSNLNSKGVATLASSTLEVGTHTMTATYNGDSNFAPSTSPVLYQAVQGAIAVLSPTSLNFGNETVGITSTPQNVGLSNMGNINLTITSIEITGVNSSDFTQKNNCPASLPPNENCTISVTFTPQAVGARNAAVSVSDSGPNSPQSATLMGVGVQPAVTFSPTNLIFPTTVVFSASAPQRVTLTNTGLGTLEIASAKISPQFGAMTNCGKTLASGASCTADVTFKPTTKGQINGSITLTDNASNSPQQLPLLGTGTFVELTPSNLNFGSQPVNSTSVPKVITVVNKGDAAVNFTGAGISIGGADSSDFAQTNNCGTSLPSGAHCYIKVTFTPLQQGKRSADVFVSDDGGGSPQIVSLAGTGTP